MLLPSLTVVTSLSICTVEERRDMILFRGQKALKHFKFIGEYQHNMVNNA
jgi:hypothetical protein